MRKRLLIAFAVSAVAATGWAMWVQACDRDKQTAAGGSTSRSGVTAVTADSKGQCAGHGVTDANKMGTCPYHASATTASHEGCSMKSSNATASHEGCAMKSSNATASHEGCATKSSTASVSCEGHGASAVTASNAGKACCAAKSNGATATAFNHQACALGAGMIGAPACGDRDAATASMRGTCDACANMLTCSTEMTANGVQTQVVPLKNGVMFVYTTDTPAHVRAVQNALARRSDRLAVLAQEGDRAKLCPECKTARGAIASGKLTRETVNIEGGCMTLVTSSDPALVAKLRALATMSNGRNKS